MDIVFFGTSDFAVPSLLRIVESRHKVLAVVTQPDKKKGRLQKVLPVPVKEAALKLKLPLMQPQDLSDKNFIDGLKGQNADLFVVVSYGNILKKELLDIPKRFCINAHASLLPKYRGAAPVNWAIINGDIVSGVTIIRMNERMDEGEVIVKKELAILNSDTAESLFKRLADEGSLLLLEALGLIESGKAVFKKQDGSCATYAPKLKKEDGLIDWNKTAMEIQNKLRGMQPWPGAYTYLNGKLIKILKAGVYGSDSFNIAGQVIGIEKDGILVSTRAGSVIIEELQPESSRRMDVNAFLSGHKIKVNDVFGK